MARGWESKAVDAQIADAEVDKATREAFPTTEAARERARVRDALMLNRARTLQSLQMACNGRHRALLESTLADLDARLKALEA
ncbi:MAG: hypothetical protein IT183_10235 [Acidobacteria bacterium]|nr:hypothetical protein [Acidobacteriota bacterium]